jgi:uncharacterized protein (TIGR03083 family)
VEKTLEFPVLLRLIDERSIAFRAAAVSAPDLGLQVPTCPEWTLLDLVQHLGGVHRRWTTIVEAGPATDAPDESAADLAKAAPREREALLAWSAASTQQLLDALRRVGPDRGCWTWWGDTQSPQTSGAVARHQLQEVMVHTYDAQNTVGTPEPLPDEAALDGVDDFLITVCERTDPWPHEDAAIDVHATEGRSWRHFVSADGARTIRLPAPGTVPATTADQVPDMAFASIRGTAAELVLYLYDRIPINSLQLDGDLRLFDQLREWD